MGECSEVGQYLAMARQADREGYPEIAEAFKRYAWEEAEHASKFAELIGDIVWGHQDQPVQTYECRVRRLRGQDASGASGQGAESWTPCTIPYTRWPRTKLVMDLVSRVFTIAISRRDLDGIKGEGVARFERPLLLRILFLRYFLSEFPQKTFENGAQDAVQLVGDPVVTRAYDLCHFGDVVELVADVLNGRTYRNQIDDQGDQGEKHRPEST